MGWEIGDLKLSILFGLKFCLMGAFFSLKLHWEL